MIRVIRGKIPKGWTYPVKASVLEGAVAKAGLLTPVSLFLHHSAFWANWPLFTANFYLAGALVKNEQEEFWLRCCSVAAADGPAISMFIEAEVIPAFAFWAAEIVALPNNATRRRSSGLEWNWPHSEQAK